MKVNRFFLPGLLFVLLFSTVGVAQWSGNWIVSGKQMIDPSQLTSGADIRGWMTFEEVSLGTGMGIDALYAALGVPADVPPQTAMKEMESVLPGFETTVVREVVDAFLAQPAQADPNPTPLPAATATPLPAIADPVPTVHTPVGEGAGEGVGEGDGTGGPAPLPAGEILAGSAIKGSHTLAGIADQAQISLPDLLTKLGLPLDTDAALRVRDLVEQGLVGEVDDLRGAVTALQEGK